MKKVIIGISVLVVVFLAIFFYLRNSEDKHYKEEGASLIKKVEIYKEDYGKLPESVKDLNIAPEMGEGPYYKRIDSLKYIIYFNIGFDNTLTYYSESKDWKENP